MNDIENGYEMPKYDQPTKRYCMALDLKNDPELIAEYKKRHSPEFYWKEIGEGIREVGMLNMEIFILDCKLFMIIEAGLDFDFVEAFDRMAKLPRQAEWQEYMAIFQDVDDIDDKTDPKRWNMMERIYVLP